MPQTTSETLTRDDVRALVGPVDDIVAAEIVGTGATREELARAYAWVENNEPMLNEGRRLPTGREARLVEILEEAAAEDDEAVAPPAATPGDGE
ncbi:hypothetical protein [Salinarimonas sp.]|uniref:hypothetical protein n=1 Tax=Salinarimonas sp. TaxID=2766526 RepID=UPI00391C8E76